MLRCGVVYLPILTGGDNEPSGTTGKGTVHQLAFFTKEKSESQVLDSMSVLAQQLGFDYCSYGLHMPILSNSQWPCYATIR